MRLPWVILSSTFLTVPAVSVTAAESLSMQEVETVVLHENASIKAARANWEMMKAKVPQAAAWEDLRLGVDSVAARFITVPANSFMDQTIMLEQELPISGKNRSRARAATAEAGGAFEELRRTELEMVSRARVAYSRLGNGYAQLGVNQRNEELLKLVVQISQRRSESALATQSDVLMAQTEEAKLEENRADIQRQISEAQSALNVLMNRPAQAPLKTPVEESYKTRVWSLKEWQALATLRRPELQIAQSRIEADKAKLQLANRQWVPDPSLNVKAQRYNEASQAISELDVGVSIPLPWLNHRKYSSGIMEARKSLETSQHEFEAKSAETMGLVRDQLTKIKTLATQYELYRDKILPLARQTVETNRAAYEAGTGGTLELITTRRTLQEADSAALSRLADYEAAIAELDALVGIDAGRHTLKASARQEKK